MSAMAEPVTWQAPAQVDGRSYARAAVRTHLVHVKEPILDVLRAYVTPVFEQGDVLVLSEKFVAITQGRVIHRSLVRPGLLARLLVKGVTKLKDDVGFSDPAKMQVAIMRAGWARMAFAMCAGGVTRLFGRHGDFYRLAGNRVSEIDGFNPHTVRPFNEFAMLG
ncbi:MAG: F420-0--gamma-glutamyl ligase, partial [Candidatus Dormibacteraeota bacterium]|nr:F420-0--gamma-glutamyl ligase [Candidatus Dormibacteraeota bacterium]